MGTKIRVAVLYGGRSGEHEISLRSAASVIRELDRSKFEVIPIGIDRQGRWLVNDVSLIGSAESMKLPSHENAVVLPPGLPTGAHQLVPLRGGSKGPAFDVVFPVVHGPLCEDGTIQGLFELADVPYVGAGVLGSAVAMDKEVAKRLASASGIPVVPWILVRAAQWNTEGLEGVLARLKWGYPVFVKPANLGSSVGISKVKKESDLKAAIIAAFQYDEKVLIEKGIDAREIEMSVLEDIRPNSPPMVSVPGEIAPSTSHEFYSYESKYLDENGAELIIPAKLSPAQVKTAQDIGLRAFTALECEGMARVDLFLDRKSGEFYLNEINTLPGFTSISMYPKLWEASGIGYSELLTRLVELALSRHKRREKLVREFHSK